MRGRGVSTRVRSPRAAPGVTAPVHWPPRKAWRASTTGEKRQVGPGAGRASSRRPTRAGGAVTGWTSACTTMGGAGVGPTTARSQRRGAGRPVARPLERRACRRTQALRRHVAAGRSRRVSSRARRRSRLASASRAGPSTGGEVPGAPQPGQWPSVPPVGGAPVARLCGQQGGGDDPAAIAWVQQGAREPGAAGARVRDADALLPLRLQLPSQRITSALPGADRTEGEARRAMVLGDRGDRERLLVDLSSDRKRARRLQG